MHSNKIPKKKSRRRTEALLERLKKVESPNVTFCSDRFPVVMKRASGLEITDVDNNRYLDFTACFGVLALGHRSPVTLKAMRKQAAQVIHGMGDVHPTASKVKFLEALADISPYNSAKSLLSLSGGEAVEAALKTAMLVTKRHGFVSFSGGYHGLQFGPLSLSDRTLFTGGFEPWLEGKSTQIPFPHNETEKTFAPGKTFALSFFKNQHDLVAGNVALELLETALKSQKHAALVMEPLQGRGGERTYPEGFVQECAFLAKKYGSLLIFDEIYTGLGRTGKMFALEHSGVVPDLLCVGKALGGGLPLSACVGEILDVWGKSEGEARHTSTFLGHPLACAVGTETLKAIKKHLPAFQKELPNIEKCTENFLSSCEEEGIFTYAPLKIRGTGFMRGLWFFANPPGFAAWLAEELLEKGFIVLPSGPRGDVLSFTPPLIATSEDFKKLYKSLLEILHDIPAEWRAPKNPT